MKYSAVATAALIAAVTVVAACASDVEDTRKRPTDRDVALEGDVQGPPDAASTNDVGADADRADTRPGDVHLTGDTDASTIHDTRVDDTSDEDTTPTPIPEGACPSGVLDASGTAWTGWANLQWPHTLTVAANTQSEPIFGQVWRAGHTDSPGQAAGWKAELLVGPLGAHPLQSPGCFRAFAASYNVDDGNNDEYQVRLTIERAGLYAMFFRYRPPGGKWFYADTAGGTTGTVEPDAGARLIVTAAPEAGRALVIATLNMMCRAGDWPRRRALIVDALDEARADLIGLQEDCLDPATNRSQASELRQALAERQGRGFDLLRQTTHQSTFDARSFDEGISALTAFPIDAQRILSLPYTHFHRRALAVDLTANGHPLRFYNTHFDHSSASYDKRTASAQLIVDDFASTTRRPIVVGDLNSSPTADAITTLSAALTDAWRHEHPQNPGHTFPTHELAVRLDYIFVPTPLAGMLEGTRLLDKRDGALHMSDHHGVATALAID
ncbi:MAG: endonuclease/exonuclease/phosphatase family protein [Bradymonadaceae bacterium]|nr:endonuclease/exonuclease/phosphatase family protein [Lujinxingiaceae bacterium]